MTDGIVADLDASECVQEVGLAAVQVSREALLQAAEALATRIRHLRP